MSTPPDDKNFSVLVADLYQKLLVPMIFESYAADLADRLARMRLSEVLEIAAGTGVVTRELAARLPHSVSIVATDLNPPMIDQARQVGTARPVQWRQADAMQLPFPDGAFDAVVCQFGVMFFPDKPTAYAQARRVLRPEGLFLFNVWDRIAENEFAAAVNDALAQVFPQDAPAFLNRAPYGYHELDRIRRDLSQAGFDSEARITTVAAQSRCASARMAAVAYCQGSPLRDEIEQRAPGRLEQVTDAVAVALAGRFGNGPLSGKIQAHVVEIAA